MDGMRPNRPPGPAGGKKISPYDVGAYPHTLVSIKQITAGQPAKVNFFDGQSEQLGADTSYRTNGNNAWQTGIGGAVQMVLDIIGIDGGAFVPTGGATFMDRFNDWSKVVNRAYVKLIRDTSQLLDWSSAVDLTGPLPWVFYPQKVEDDSGNAADVAAGVAVLIPTPAAALAGPRSNVAYPYEFKFSPDWRNSDQSMSLVLEASGFNFPTSLDNHFIRLRLRGMDHASQPSRQ